MKKAVFLLLVLSSALYFVQHSWFSATDTAQSLTKLNNDLKEMATSPHKDLYQEEIQKLAFRLQQEPYVQLNQRYSRKILTAVQTKNKTEELVQVVPNDLKSEVVNEESLKYTIQRTEQLSGSFQQAKIYATVNSRDKGVLKLLCREIQEQYSGYNSLVICLYRATETGIALAKGNNVQYSEQDIINTWLVFIHTIPLKEIILMVNLENT